MRHSKSTLTTIEYNVLKNRQTFYFMAVVVVVQFTFDTRGLQFESSHRQTFIQSFFYCQRYEKRPGMTHFFNKSTFYFNWMQCSGAVGKEDASNLWDPRFKFLPFIYYICSISARQLCQWYQKDKNKVKVFRIGKITKQVF